VSQAEQALWEARIAALERDAGEILLQAAAGLVETGAGPGGLRAEARRILGEAALRSGDALAAVTHFAAMAELSGRARQVYALLRQAEAARVAGALDQALAAAERALQLAPEQVETSRILARLMLAAGRPAVALRHLRRAQAVLPDDPGLLEIEAACLLRSGQAEPAESLLAPLRLRAEEDATVAYRLAWVRSMGGDQQASLRWLERALALAGPERVLRWLQRAPDLAPLLAVPAWQGLLDSVRSKRAPAAP